MTEKGVALVTGGALRIGRAIVERLAAEGFGVIVHYGRSRLAAEELVTELTTSGHRAAAIQADLGEAGAVDTLIARAAGLLGPITVLVNNAAMFIRDEIDDATVSGWDRQIAFNLRAPFFLSQGFARQLPDGVEGNIVNLIDMRVKRLTPHFMSYTLSKTGLYTLTQTLAMALAPRVRVNGIGPGPVLKSHFQSEEQFRQQWEATPLKRGAPPEEIADGVCYLLQARGLTGQMIALDGGQHLPWPPLTPALADLD